MGEGGSEDVGRRPRHTRIHDGQLHTSDVWEMMKVYGNSQNKDLSLCPKKSEKLFLGGRVT